jgi:hypothetical protein
MVVAFSLEIVAREKNCLFQRFCPSVAFVILHNNVQLHINTWEDYNIDMGRKWSP